MNGGDGGLGQVGESTGRRLQVARENLHAPVCVVKLAANAVVLLLSPYLVGAHTGETFGGRLDGARQHETTRLEQGHLAPLNDAGLLPAPPLSPAHSNSSLALPPH